MDKKQEKAPSNVQLQNQIKDTNSKLDKLTEVLSKQTEGVGIKSAIEPKKEAPKPMGSIPQRFRDAVSKILGEDFGLELRNNEETLSVIVPEKYSVYHTPGEIASRKSHHKTLMTDEENRITRKTPDVPDDVLKERLVKWEEKHPLVIPQDIRPLAFVEAVVPGKWESYCELVKRNIEKELDTKI